MNCGFVGNNSESVRMPMISSATYPRAMLACCRLETFPGCVAAIANKDGLLYYQSHGSFTYGKHAPFSGGNPLVRMVDFAAQQPQSCIED